MPYLSKDQLNSLGFKKLGINVKVSDKASIYNPGAIELDNDVRIDDFCILSAGDKGITIGKNVHIAAYCSLLGQEKIEMHDFSGLSSRVSIYSSSDDYSGNSLTNPCVPDEFRNVQHGAVSLGRHVIIGVGAVILPGCTINEGVAVGSLSLVNKDCEEFGIYVGTPAKKVKERSRNLLDIELEYHKEKFKDY